MTAKPRWHVIIIMSTTSEKFRSCTVASGAAPNFHLIDHVYIRLKQRLPIGTHGAETATPQN